jgi:hypothetical protein
MVRDRNAVVEKVKQHSNAWYVNVKKFALQHFPGTN